MYNNDNKELWYLLVSLCIVFIFELILLFGYVVTFGQSMKRVYEVEESTKEVIEQIEKYAQ